MPTSNTGLQEHLLDLAWSLWTELGVSGWERRHTSHAIDPEPLIIFTAWLGDTDPRLRDESIDWCIRYGRHVSGARLRNLLSDEREGRRSSFGWYAATVAANSPFRWPFATEPRRYEPTGKSHLEDLARPSLISLRMRSIFGVTARADILRVMLGTPGTASTAADLAPDVGYTKRNVAEALEALRIAGILDVTPWRNQLKYRLAKVDALVSLVGEVPAIFPRWRSVFRVAMRSLETTQMIEDLPANVRFVEADKALREMEGDLQDADLPGPSPSDQPREKIFSSWANDLVRSLAFPEPTSWPTRRLGMPGAKKALAGERGAP